MQKNEIKYLKAQLESNGSTTVGGAETSSLALGNQSDEARVLNSKQRLSEENSKLLDAAKSNDSSSSRLYKEKETIYRVKSKPKNPSNGQKTH